MTILVVRWMGFMIELKMWPLSGEEHRLFCALKKDLWEYHCFYVGICLRKNNNHCWLELLSFVKLIIFTGCNKNCSIAWSYWPWDWRHCYIWKARNSQDSNGTWVACNFATNWCSCWFNSKCKSGLPRRVRLLNAYKLFLNQWKKEYFLICDYNSWYKIENVSGSVL